MRTPAALGVAALALSLGACSWSEPTGIFDPLLPGVLCPVAPSRPGRASSKAPLVPPTGRGGGPRAPAPAPCVSRAPAGASVIVRLDGALDPASASPGDPLTATLLTPLRNGSRETLVGVGASMTGRVASVARGPKAAIVLSIHSIDTSVGWLPIEARGPLAAAGEAALPPLLAGAELEVTLTRAWPLAGP
jgi:hypothetical protein